MLIDLFSQPHDDGSTGTVSQNQYNVHKPSVTGGRINGEHTLSVHQHGVTDSGDQSQTNGQDTGDRGQLLLTGLAFLSPLFELRNCDGQKLDHDGSRNVGRYRQGKQRSLRESAAGEHIQPTKCVTAGFKIVLKCSGVNPRHRQGRTKAVQHDDHQGKEDLVFQLGNFPRVL